MAVVFTQAGEVIALSNMVNNTAPQNLILRLYTNNQTPTALDTASNYTELVGYGYSSVTLIPGSFTFATGVPCTASYPIISFNFTGAAGYIYGYFVTQASSGQLMYANRFSNAPIQIANSGDQIRVTMTLQMQNSTSGGSTLVFTQTGEVVALQNIVNNTAPQSLVLRLFSNNYTPSSTDTVSNYTELSGYGYSSVALTPSNFTFTQGNPVTGTYPQITFTFTGAAGLIYGYFVTQASSGNLIFANRFSNAPISIANNGDQIRVTLTLQLANQ
jgi:hypothetical protein